MLRAISISPEAKRAFQGWFVIFLMMIMLGEVYMRSSTPAAVALNFAEHNAAVQNAVGGAAHAQLNWIGHIHYEGNEGWASFEMYVTGARTSGTMDITLQRQRGHWTVAGGQLVTDSGSVIKITEPANRTDQPRAVN
jgi:hypothetical protein